MSRGLILALGYAITASVAHAQNPGTPFSDPIPTECSVVPAPPAETLEPYRKGGPYAAGVQRLKKGRHREAARELAGAWRKVRADLAAVFSTTSCEPGRIRALLSRTLFRAPPLVVPGEDRFLPPPEVRETMAHSLCVTGRMREAANLLLEAAMAGDDDARSSAGVLFAASGRPDLCLSLWPENRTDPAAMLTRAYCLVRANRSIEAEALVSRAGPVRGPRMEALHRLVRSAIRVESRPRNPEAP